MYKQHQTTIKKTSQADGFYKKIYSEMVVNQDAKPL